MARVPLERLALGRSGDKGDGSNIGLVARSEPAWTWLLANVTGDFVKETFGEIAAGRVDRYEVAGLRALNFVLHDSLGGGGASSLLTDAQGKTHAQALLRVMVEVPEDVVAGLDA
ncbi:MAG: AtuA-related protein [Acidobacteriota bacterium]